MKTNNKTPLALSVGAVLLTSYLPSSAQSGEINNNEVNPFAMTELSSGYMELAEADMVKAAEGMKKVEKAADSMKKMEGGCGEGKCGAGMMDGAKKSVPEGNCAGKKLKKMDKTAEGKCGEGKCGNSKK